MSYDYLIFSYAFLRRQLLLIYLEELALIFIGIYNWLMKRILNINQKMTDQKDNFEIVSSNEYQYDESNEKAKKVGILYIALGNYTSLFKDFYNSCETNLFPGIEKNYYLFTDGLKEYEYNNITIILTEDRGWPLNTLMRFEMFLSVYNLWKDNNFMLFLNGNTLITEKIDLYELFPDNLAESVTVLSWYVYDSLPINKLPYDRNPKSKAFIPFGQGRKYYQGGLFGARTNVFYNLVTHINNMVNIDMTDGVIARNHDESHLNRYLLDKEVYILDTRYGKPEEWKKPENAKIIFRDKNRVLGTQYIKHLKNHKPEGILKRFFHFIKTLWR